MAAITKLRRNAASFILRGKVLDLWVRRKWRRLERKCLEEMVSTAASPLPASTPSPRRSGGEQLRKIVFIADIMWEGNDLVPELEKICPVETLDLRPILRAQSVSGERKAAIVEKAVDDFLKLSREQAPDLVFFYARSELLSDETLAKLRKAWPCPLIGMNLDDKVEFFPYNIFSSGSENYVKWAAHFDLTVTNSLIATEWYRQRELPCAYIAPGFHRPEGLLEPVEASFRYPVSFLGSKKLDREIVVNRLRSCGVSVEVFGSGWTDGKWVTNPVAVFQDSQINLGIGSATPNFTTVKARDFECPGIGACYLTSYNWELANWWDIGKEILCYRNLEEAVEIVSYYKRRPEECLKIARAAFRRASEHTWEQRFRKIFRESLGFRLP